MRKSKEFDNVYSYSKLTSFFRCPWLYFQEYVLKLPIKPNNAMLRGRKIHALAEKLVQIDSEDEVRKIFNGMPEEEIQHAVKYAEFYSNKFLCEQPEFEAEIDVGNGNTVEIHADRLDFDEWGNLFMLDLKSGSQLLSKDEISRNFQLNFYAWVYIQYLSTIKNLEETKANIKQGRKKFFIGQYSWGNDMPIFAEWDANVDYQARITETIKEISDLRNEGEDAFPKRVNEFCSGCPYINSCIPDSVPDTLAGLKHRIKQLEAQKTIKEAHMIATFDGLGTTVLPASKENGCYYLRGRKDYDYNKDEVYEKLKNKPEDLKEFLKVSKTVMERVGIDPATITSTLKSSSVWVDFKTELLNKKPKEKKK